MLATFLNYRTWADAHTLDERVKIELLNGIDWMEKNVAIIDPLIFEENDHPCTAFSLAIKSLIKNETFQPLINWLAENKKCPFGLMLKTKAYKALIRSRHLLTKYMINQLTDMQQRSLTLQYRPREYLYLDKLLSDPTVSTTQS